MDIRRLVGLNVRQMRKERGWSQEDLAFESGLDRTYVSGVERGVRNPTVLVLYELAQAFKVPTARLLQVGEFKARFAKTKRTRAWKGKNRRSIWASGAIEQDCYRAAGIFGIWCSAFRLAERRQQSEVLGPPMARKSSASSKSITRPKPAGLVALLMRVKGRLISLRWWNNGPYSKAFWSSWRMVPHGRDTISNPSVMIAALSRSRKGSSTPVLDDLRQMKRTQL
jgi:transcriptional regulator with XRE-family HTH domain